MGWASSGGGAGIWEGEAGRTEVGGDTEEAKAAHPDEGSPIGCHDAVVGYRNPTRGVQGEMLWSECWGVGATLGPPREVSVPRIQGCDHHNIGHAVRRTVDGGKPDMARGVEEAWGYG